MKLEASSLQPLVYGCFALGERPVEVKILVGFIDTCNMPAAVIALSQPLNYNSFAGNNLTQANGGWGWSRIVEKK